MNHLSSPLRMLLLLTALLLTLTIVAGLSIHDRHSKLKERASLNQQTLTSMQQMLEEIQSLQRQNNPIPSTTGPNSLLSTIEQSIKQQQLGPCMRQIEPDNQPTHATIEFTDCSFNRLLKLLLELKLQHNIHLIQGNFTPHSNGRAHASLTLGIQ